MESDGAPQSCALAFHDVWTGLIAVDACGDGSVALSGRNTGKENRAGQGKKAAPLPLFCIPWLGGSTCSR